MIRIPNADVFNQPIANYSKGFNYNWYEIPVVVTYESNWKKTKQLLTDLISDYCKQYEDQLKRELRQAQKDYPINYTYITPTIYTTSLDHGISLTILNVTQSSFQVNIISHTLEHTTLSNKELGMPVHLEYDIIGKYCQRYVECYGKQNNV